jgi:putative zinc finger protein
MNTFDQNNLTCRLENVVAYLDGELDVRALESFEAHVKVCPGCAAELRMQRQLLCTLDSAFGNSRGFELPRNFTRIVAAHARSDVGGVRRKREGRRALQLCVILALLSFALLGAASGAMVFEPVRGFARITGNLLDLVWRIIYDAGTGLVVIVRVVVRAMVFDSHGLGLLAILPFAIVVILLPRLIARYHRAQVAE